LLRTLRVVRSARLTIMWAKSSNMNGKLGWPNFAKTISVPIGRILGPFVLRTVARLSNASSSVVFHTGSSTMGPGTKGRGPAAEVIEAGINPAGINPRAEFAKFEFWIWRARAGRSR
jgi:hypothetical protein